MRSKTSVTGAIVMIVLGAIFLLSNHGMIPPLGPLFAKWWPLFLIIPGVLTLIRRGGSR